MLLPFSCMVLFLASVSAQGPGEPEEQKFGAILTSALLVCDDEDSKTLVVADKLVADIYNETTSYIDGAIAFLKDITDDVTTELTLIKEENGQAKLVMSVCVNLCEEMLNPEGDYQFILQFVDVGGTCPFEAGEHKVNYFILDLSDMPINGSNQGCYVAKISLFKGPCDDKEKVFIGCVYLSFCIEPLE